jgi:DNA-binding NtrC family response regulator
MVPIVNRTRSHGFRHVLHETPPAVLPDVVRVLVVDDEPLMRLAVRQALTDSGCTVCEAADARAARGTLAATLTPFDVVVLDYQMPDNDDLALLASVRRMAPTSRVIMMTAHPSGTLTAGAERLGASCVLRKPVDLEELCRLVQVG